jgi:predicted ATPase
MRSVPDLELKLQLGLASSLVFTKGPGSMEVRSAYSRAMDLCKLSKPNELHFAAYWGWWKISYDYAIHKERADDILKLSQKLNKSELVMQAHHCQWATQFYLGHIQSCCDHIRDGLAEYDSENHLAEASLYGGHDAKVCALGELALSEWLLGKMDTSVSSMAKSMSWAKQSGHTGSIAHALDICLMLRVYADEYEAMKVEAEELISFAEKHKSPDHLAKGYIYHGWATANLGNERSGFTNFMRGIDLQREIGTREDFAVFDCMRTYFHRINKEYSAAIELLNNTLDEANHKSIVNWNSEIIRYRASLMSFSDSSTRVEIFDEFEKARKVAEKFGMNSLQLKVLNSAVEYSLATGSVSKDLSVRFNNLLSGFTEGFNTKLLKSSLNLQRQIS